VPGAAFFKNLGVFTIEGFLTAEECAHWRKTVRDAPLARARVGHYESKVKEEVRKTKSSRVSAQARDPLLQRIRELQPNLEKHFGISATYTGESEFLLYGPRDKFEAHRDVRKIKDKPGMFRRQLTVVTFLNAWSEKPAEGCYTGGELFLHGLMDFEGAEGFGFPLEPTPGLLVAFPSDTVHRVAPIESGERFSVVTWFD
jgi:predicted 2-oxoglutarate/Fe(II)-dependent dioxygenase YbiX